MNELVLGLGLILIAICALAFYFYSRLLFTERKITLLEAILMDIKMAIEAEDERNEWQVAPQPKMVSLGGSAPAPTNAVEHKPIAPEDIIQEEELYADLLQQAPDELPAKAEETATAVPDVAEETDYDSMSRDELVSLAEKKGLRTNKRMNKGAVVKLLREADKNSSTSSQAGKDASPTGASGPFAAVEGSGGGAPLELAEADIGSLEVDA